MGELMVLMGPTGAGKSVQGDLVAERHGGVHLSSGKLLRADPTTVSGLVSGQLAPAAEVQRVVGEALSKVPQEKLVVLDGFPRTESDLAWLDKHLTGLGRRLTHVVLLELTQEESLNRLSKRGRADDTPAALAEKWRAYESRTQIVEGFFGQRKLLRKVNGHGTIEEVHERVEAAIS